MKVFPIAFKIYKIWFHFVLIFELKSNIFNFFIKENYTAQHQTNIGFLQLMNKNKNKSIGWKVCKLLHRKCKQSPTHGSSPNILFFLKKKPTSLQKNYGHTTWDAISITLILRYQLILCQDINCQVCFSLKLLSNVTLIFDPLTLTI